MNLTQIGAAALPPVFPRPSATRMSSWPIQTAADTSAVTPANHASRSSFEGPVLPAIGRFRTRAPLPVPSVTTLFKRSVVAYASAAVMAAKGRKLSAPEDLDRVLSDWSYILHHWNEKVDDLLVYRRFFQGRNMSLMKSEVGKLLKKLQRLVE